ncbi:MAG: FAD-dependent oxidoreductase, partial [Firmicutes bacterium]|nr:FAD-dependent oxidoreductase [Bacillota bacterium]
MAETVRIGIVGGGLSGLSAAFALERLWPEDQPLEIVLWEKSARLGGLIHTDRTHGSIWEYGPDSFLRRKPEMMALVHDLGLDAQLIGLRPEAHGADIYYPHRLERIPEGVKIGVPSRFDTILASNLLSDAGKQAVLRDKWVDPIVPEHEDISLGRVL